MRARLASFALAAALLATLASGCLSPTLPLPPPDPDSIHASTTVGSWIVAGTCNVAGHTILVKNESTQLGRSAPCDKARRYSVEIEAKACDMGTVTELDSKDSELAQSNQFFFEQTTNGFQSTCK